MQTAIARARRAVEEVRIRGVTTNQAFLGKLLDDPDFRAGNLHTTFIDERPQLTAVAPGGDRATRILRLLAERTVNRPFGRAPAGPDPRTKLPAAAEGRPARGLQAAPRRARAPRASRSWLRSRDALQLTDTTLRDAHQSLFATRMRTHDMEVVAPHLARLLGGRVLAGGVGRRDVRRRAALPRRGPVGAHRAAARAHPERLPADAPARAQPARLRALPGRGRPRVRLRGGRRGRRHLPDLRRAEQRRADARGDRGDRRGGRRRGGRHLLHRRPARPGRAALHARPLPRGRRAARRGRRAHPRHQGHGGPAAGAGGGQARAAGCGASSTSRCTCTRTTRPAASSRPTSPRSRRASTPSTAPPRRWRA